MTCFFPMFFFFRCVEWMNQSKLAWAQAMGLLETGHRRHKFLSLNIWKLIIGCSVPTIQSLPKNWMFRPFAGTMRCWRFAHPTSTISRSKIIFVGVYYSVVFCFVDSDRAARMLLFWLTLIHIDDWHRKSTQIVRILSRFPWYHTSNNNNNNNSN